MKTPLLIALLGALACAGCANLMVPKTEIKGNIGGHDWSLSSPKDSELTGLQITAETNGSMSIVIQGLKARMSPEVIQMTGDAFVNGINAIGTQVINGVTTGAKTAVK